MLVDRADEVAELRELLRRGRPQLALLYGRRRVGKSFLLTNTWPEGTTFYFTASETTPEQNRVTLLDEIQRWSGRAIEPSDYLTWRTIFRLLLSLRVPGPLIVVLDEFQYLGGTERELASVASELNAVWEERRAPRPFVLALAGSAVRPMAALSAGGAPLHGRFNWQHRLEPLDYWYAGEMSGFRSLRERAAAYGIFGGIPRYLAAIAPARSLWENVSRLMLSPRGEVRLQVETALLQEQGLRDVATYRAVLRGIAGGATLQNDIAQAAGVPNDTTLRDKLIRLGDLGYIRATRNLGAKKTDPFRFRIADPAQRFHAAFVARLETELARNQPRQVWDAYVRPQLDSYMGPVFEDIAQQAYTRLRATWRLPMVHTWGRWEGRDRDGQSLEMDIACETSDGGALTGQVKWNDRPIGAAVHHHHVRMLDRLGQSGVAWAHRALKPDAPLLYIAAGGFTAAFTAAAHASGHPVVMWTLKDLYATPKRRPRRALGAS